jgi:hypothetical protein
MFGEHLGCRATAALVTRAAETALADQRLGQVSELSQVAGRTNRSLAGDHR